jgi:hypothetical protein
MSAASDSYSHVSVAKKLRATDPRLTMSVVALAGTAHAVTESLTDEPGVGVLSVGDQQRAHG